MDFGSLLKSSLAKGVMLARDSTVVVFAPWLVASFRAEDSMPISILGDAVKIGYGSFNCE
jgi:hypothetical protein